MNVLPKTQIKAERAQFQRSMNALLYCNDPIEEAIDLAYEYDRTGNSELAAERMVRNMLALDMVSKMIVTWSKGEP
jgi:hypothetical protein